MARKGRPPIRELEIGKKYAAGERIFTPVGPRTTTVYQVGPEAWTQDTYPVEFDGNGRGTVGVSGGYASSETEPLGPNRIGTSRSLGRIEPADKSRR